jgi:hypothetical protein
VAREALAPSSYHVGRRSLCVLRIVGLQAYRVAFTSDSTSMSKWG